MKDEMKLEQTFNPEIAGEGAPFLWRRTPARFALGTGHACFLYVGFSFVSDAFLDVSRIFFLDVFRMFFRMFFSDVFFGVSDVFISMVSPSISPWCFDVLVFLDSTFLSEVHRRTPGGFFWSQCMLDSSQKPRT